MLSYHHNFLILAVKLVIYLASHWLLNAYFWLAPESFLGYGLVHYTHIPVRISCWQLYHVNYYVISVKCFYTVVCCLFVLLLGVDFTFVLYFPCHLWNTNHTITGSFFYKTVISEINCPSFVKGTVSRKNW